MTVNICCFK